MEPPGTADLAEDKAYKKVVIILVLRWILRKIRRRVPGLVVMTLAQVGHALLGVLFALGSRGVIDSAVSRDREAFLEACVVQGSIIAGILVCLFLTRHLKERLRADLDKDWKQHQLRGLLHGDYSAVSAYHSGELLNRLNADVARVNEGVLTIVPSFSAMAARLLGAVGALGALDPGFTGLVLALGCVVILGTWAMRRRLKELNKRVSEMDGKVSGFLQEAMEKLLMVQAMDAAEEIQRRSDGLLADRYRLQRKRKNVSLLTNTGISVLSYGAGFGALVWCAEKMLQGAMSFGSLTAVIQLVNQLQAPFVNLTGVMPQYAAMLASAERLMELEAIPPEAEACPEAPGALYAGMDAIQGQDLHFSYGRERVLEGASFSIPKGAFAVITGPSGMGKSTLLKLMLGIFPPEAGALWLAGSENRRALNRSTRRLFAYVPQGNLLLSGTVRENLTIANVDASEEAIREAVRVSCMDAFLPTLPQGLDTVLGEGGTGLSEGQAQRLAIGRAVLSGAPVLLLDECTSALDAQTEREVLTRLRSLAGRTCIAVTHRTPAEEMAEIHLRVQDGKILTES